MLPEDRAPLHEPPPQHSAQTAPARAPGAGKISTLCKSQPFDVCTHCPFVFINSWILFVQACSSSTRLAVQRSGGVKRRAEGGGSVSAHSCPLLPGDHGAGLGLVGRNGGGAELGEAAVAGLQAGHGTPEWETRHQRPVRSKVTQQHGHHITQAAGREAEGSWQGASDQVITAVWIRATGVWTQRHHL